MGNVSGKRKSTGRGRRFGWPYDMTEEFGAKQFFWIAFVILICISAITGLALGIVAFTKPSDSQTALNLLVGDGGTTAVPLPGSLLHKVQNNCNVCPTGGSTGTTSTNTDTALRTALFGANAPIGGPGRLSNVENALWGTGTSGTSSNPLPASVVGRVNSLNTALWGTGTNVVDATNPSIGYTVKNIQPSTGVDIVARQALWGGDGTQVITAATGSVLQKLQPITNNNGNTTISGKLSVDGRTVNLGPGVQIYGGGGSDDQSFYIYAGKKYIFTNASLNANNSNVGYYP